MEITDVDVSTLTPVADFAKQLGKSYETLHRWYRRGTWNRSKTRLVRLRLIKTAGGLALNEEIYRDFINQQNEY